MSADELAHREALRIAHVGRPRCYRRDKLWSDACATECMLATNGRTEAETVRVLCGERVP